MCIKIDVSIVTMIFICKRVHVVFHCNGCTLLRSVHGHASVTGGRRRLQLPQRGESSGLSCWTAAWPRSRSRTLTTTSNTELLDNILQTRLKIIVLYYGCSGHGQYLAASGDMTLWLTYSWCVYTPKDIPPAYREEWKVRDLEWNFLYAALNVCLETCVICEHRV